LPDVAVKVVDPGQSSRAGISACLGADRNVCPTKGSLSGSRGSLLFTHFGVSGPVVLDVSHAVSGHPQPTTLLLRCDLLPEFSEEPLDNELARRSIAAGKRRLAALLDDWLPHRVGETLVALTETPLDLPVAEFSKSQRRRLVQAIKRLDIPVAGTMGFRRPNSRPAEFRWPRSIRGPCRADRSQSVFCRRIARSQRSRGWVQLFKPPSAPAGWQGERIGKMGGFG